MKKHLLPLALAAAFGILLLSLSGCSDLDVPQPTAADPSTRTTSADLEAVYHETTDSWIRHRNDPYTVENFQRACDNLAAGRSAQTLSHEASRQLAAARIDATHYNVLIYPKTEQELRGLESMHDITISYVPFDYEQLPRAETASLDRSRAKAVFPAEGKYTVTHQGYETVEGPQPDETFTLPAIYAVWPCAKPFPADMDYRILYEVFLPEAPSHRARNTALSAEAMQALENEAIALARQDRPETRIVIGEWIAQKVSGSAFHFDNTLNKQVPLHNLKVRFQIGSKVWETYTAADGSFRIDELVSAGAVISFRFQHEKWAITQEDSRILVTETMGVHYDQWKANGLRFCPTSTRPCYEIHRAVNFYYHTAHSVPLYSYPSGIRIIASTNAHPSYGGLFYPAQKGNNAYIVIYNHNRLSHHILFGTVLHELGHFCHYGMRSGDNNAFKAIDLFIKDSFASYVGWYLEEKYYKGYGLSFGPDSIMSDQARQYWRKTYSGSDGYYSPVFVDLSDDLNQTLLYEYDDIVYEEIKSVPDLVVYRIARESAGWASCKSILQEYRDIYYRSEDLDTMLAYYDYYFTHRTS